MRDLLNRLPGDVRVPIQFVMEAIRDEMLARNYIASYSYAFATVTPEQRFNDWLSVNDRVVLEAAPIAVDSFKVDVPEPSEDELAIFFDDHKEREPQPDFIGLTEYPSPTPGFRIPRKIDVQYIQAEFDEYLAKMENEITDEEIAKYYEDNKDLFIRADTGLSDALDDGAADTPSDPPADSVDEQPADSTGDQPTDALDEQPTTDSTEQPVTDDASSEAADADATSENATNEEEPSSSDSDPSSDESATNDEPTTSGEAAAGDDAAPADDDQSSRGAAGGKSAFRLAAFLQDAESEQPPQVEQALEATSGEETIDATNDPSSAVADEDVAAEESTTAATDEEAAEPPETTGVETVESIEATGPVEYQPLEEVSDLIRRQLASRQVHDELSRLMTDLQTRLNGEFTRYFSAQLDADARDEERPAAPPALTNLAPLAEEHGLQHGTTGPLSVLELRDTPVGSSGSIDQQTELFRLLFGSDDLEMYEPVLTQDIHGNHYLAVKTSDTPGRVPELAEVRPAVVDAWKRQKAVELALKHAEELAEKAQESRSTLPEFFANESMEVVRTDPFSRYTGGEIGFVGGEIQQQPFRLSEPDGIVAAGPDFMDRVFDLKDGEVGAVLNHDKSIAYLVRIAEHMMSEDALQRAYLAEAGNWPGMNFMTRSHSQTAARLLVNDILESKGLKWERDPDQLEPDEEETPDS